MGACSRKLPMKLDMYPVTSTKRATGVPGPVTAWHIPWWHSIIKDALEGHGSGRAGYQPGQRASLKRLEPTSETERDRNQGRDGEVTRSVGDGGDGGDRALREPAFAAPLRRPAPRLPVIQPRCRATRELKWRRIGADRGRFPGGWGNFPSGPPFVQPRGGVLRRGW